MRDSMITLDEKIHRISNHEKRELSAEIRGYENIINNGRVEGGSLKFLAFSEWRRGKTKKEIIAEAKRRKALVEAKLYDTYKVNIIGWPYFDDVLYLNDDDAIADYDSYMLELKYENDDEIFMQLNYLTYLYREIHRMKLWRKEYYQHRKKKTENKMLEKAIILVLNSIDHSGKDVLYLINKLVNVEDSDNRDKIVSEGNRIQYIVAKDESQAQKNDELNKMKKEYTTQMEKFEALIKAYNPSRYKPHVKVILDIFKLPANQSKI